MRSIPAQTIQGIAAKAITLTFDSGLYPDDPDSPLNDWDWDHYCLHMFVEDVKRLASLSDCRFAA
ncbi:hypothetical protein [Mesorhizobium sp.]|uniref:hypothetical protein n=1 Tax=Mesorhizobium sp. TaxID=1871066 RepID=UPI000FE917B1|nr:hypothetical protein [Mesorhizobium sp.]RWA59454.1 MAG: hypothetical protein EOQ27_26405 [Mesorhizobium sp.]